MVNNVQIIGRTGKDTELKYTANGTAVASVSVATTEKWKSKDGNPQERTEWHSVTFWGKLAEIAGEYLTKGTLVYISGRLETDEWEKDGVKHRTTKIVANEMKLLSGKSDKKPEPKARPDDVPAGFEKVPPPEEPDDLPF